MADDRHAPRLPQNLLPPPAVHVPHVGVVLGEAKDSESKAEAERDKSLYVGSDTHDNII